MTTGSHITDEQLMEAIQQRGDEGAFNALYQRYSHRILYFMYKMLKQDEAKAQDFLQDVFIKIVEHPEKFDSSKRFKTWIFTVAANLCKNYFRSQQRSIVVLETIDVADEAVEAINWEEQQPLLLEQLNQALDDLPYVYKEAFILKHKEGLSLKEIAQVMACPLGTVKSRLNSATKKLAKKLNPYKTSIQNQ